MSEKKKSSAITGFWTNRSGQGLNTRVNSKTIEMLTSIKEGGMLFINFTEEGLKMEKGERFPDAFLDYLSPEEVQNRKPTGNGASL